MGAFITDLGILTITNGVTSVSRSTSPGSSSTVCNRSDSTTHASTAGGLASNGKYDLRIRTTSHLFGTSRKVGFCEAAVLGEVSGVLSGSVLSVPAAALDPVL